MLTTDQITRLAFSVYENPGVYALLLGSGLSRSASIPTGWEITLDLVRRVALAEGVEEQVDWASWYRTHKGKEPSYSELIGELGLSPNERRSILHSYIEPTVDDAEEGRKLPTDAHQAIADLVKGGFFKVIVTTNFDRLLENALRDRGVEPTVVASVDALAGAEPISHTRCYLAKLHGDYKDSRILNTDEELTNYPSEYDQLLDRILDEYGLIVCGWSGDWDHALRSAIMRGASRRYTTFWASRGEPSEAAKELIQHRAGSTIQIADADSFFVQLRDRVETLSRTHRPNPRSIQLIVSSAKRFLASPTHRIQLDDLVQDELNALNERIEGSSFTNGDSWSPEAFRERVAFIEAACEPIISLSMVLGRWGDGHELNHIRDAVADISAKADSSGGGLVVWTELRKYPAVLIVTGYALGLVRAERWDTLKQLLQLPVPKKYREDTSIFESLVLNAWEGASKDYWRNLEGYDRRKTPLSDHLHARFSEWSKGVLGVVADFEDLYETWEILASQNGMTSELRDELEKVTSSSSLNDWVWVPIGRSAWDGDRRTRIIQRLKSDPLKAQLLAAGFWSGDEELIELSFQNYSRLARRIDMM